jgi:hypothetical protein
MCVACMCTNVKELSVANQRRWIEGLEINAFASYGAFCIHTFIIYCARNIYGRSDIFSYISEIIYYFRLIFFLCPTKLILYNITTIN